MPATTPTHDVPYDVDTDPLGHAAAATQALAEWIDTNVGRFYSTTGVIDITAAATAAVVAVTFPAGRFDVAPTVVVSPTNVSATGITQGQAVAASDITVDGCNVRGYRTAGTADIAFALIAHQE